MYENREGQKTRTPPRQIAPTIQEFSPFRSVQWNDLYFPVDQKHHTIYAQNSNIQLVLYDDWMENKNSQIKYGARLLKYVTVSRINFLFLYLHSVAEDDKTLALWHTLAVLKLQSSCWHWGWFTFGAFGPSWYCTRSGRPRIDWWGGFRCTLELVTRGRCPDEDHAVFRLVVRFFEIFSKVLALSDVHY